MIHVDTCLLWQLANMVHRLGLRVEICSLAGTPQLKWNVRNRHKRLLTACQCMAVHGSDCSQGVLSAPVRYLSLVSVYASTRLSIVRSLADKGDANIPMSAAARIGAEVDRAAWIRMVFSYARNIILVSTQSPTYSTSLGRILGSQLVWCPRMRLGCVR
jgi:hypothetical protein